MAKYNIGGYIFDDENKAKKAAKELKAVEYILGQIKDSDENAVLTVYKKLLNQRMFSTEIGMSFLAQLRQNLLDSEVFTPEDIPPVYSLEEPPKDVTPEEKTEDTNSSSDEKVSKAKKEKADKKVVAKVTNDSSEIKRLKAINKVLLIFCIALLLCVLGMFYVSTTINSPTILDYEEKLIDKYSSWEQDLTEREEAIREKEQEQQ
ncbi:MULTISPECIES: hypothetical protein [Pseudobutyrivibrio]|uniref:Uncharacterized protein n=1 Tax=Pseudobutyrivibrio ruminis DSM 9787 TaxID=1123011 RepID=A0A285RCD6_9FIRM|nr:MULTISPECIES: hypothetical protein [Pseudobutyrivibrio]SFN96884.1 hypothetical protein SAMN05216351_102131 [Pseudobutyrivibrio sp. JW11]SOB91773.1 hypothetical protein SAMN02910411_0807 [Pseudobutyrivibrio ruminis DSM 9787]